MLSMQAMTGQTKILGRRIGTKKTCVVLHVQMHSMNQTEWLRCAGPCSEMMMMMMVMVMTAGCGSYKLNL